MTTPPEGFLFDVATPPTPVERLLLLADQYVQHNDMLDRLLRAHSPSTSNAHAASAQRLASATRTALKAVTDERLFRSPDLSDAVVRLEQLAFLSSASADQQLPMARTLTALAPEAALGCANTLAYEIRRRRGTAAGDGPEHTLSAAHHTALWEIACGNVVAISSLGRQNVHYRDERVLMGTLRALEAKGLAERVPESAPAAYVGDPLQDRVRLTPAGTTALATASSPPTRRAPGTTPAPAPTAAQTATRSR
ncbi:hypothetical protein [Streptomyces flaveolus]|uniref:hypothetical protein n=1 Tax=Streptomyces flaveolus TaxID=67297 RepID=UPI003814A4AE